MRDALTPLPPLTAEAETVGFAAPSSRRAFLSRASVLSLAIPGMGAALVACAGDRTAGDTSKAAGDSATKAGTAPIAPSAHQNSDSRLDTAVLKDVKHGQTSAAAAVGKNVSGTLFHRIAPELPPIPAGNVQRIHWHAKEALVRIADDTVVAAWTFEGDVPGPFVHTRVGDTVEFTLTNDTDLPHSMDFHAAQIDPKLAFRSIVKGDSVTFTFKPKYAGAFMFHCGTAPVLMHIGSGMFGA
ncbi:MAG: multicopper oxidase domain-containing protein, partial [bacterium]